METFTFGPDDRLFGAYHEGLGPPTAPSVLVCNGLGQDYMRSHNVLCHLARQLSAAGGPVLQFDYRGTGDSRGEPDDNTLDDLRADVATAMQELRDISGRSRTVTLGIRLGAWLALESSDQVIAWDPIVSGEAHVTALRTLARRLNDRGARREQSTGGAGSEELAGYRYSDALLASVGRLQLDDFVTGQTFRRVALIGADDAGQHPVQQLLERHSAHFTHYPAKPAQWDSLSQFERALTLFPSLSRLREDWRQW